MGTREWIQLSTQNANPTKNLSLVWIQPPPRSQKVSELFWLKNRRGFTWMFYVCKPRTSGRPMAGNHFSGERTSPWRSAGGTWCVMVESEVICDRRNWSIPPDMHVNSSINRIPLKNQRARSSSIHPNNVSRFYLQPVKRNPPDDILSFFTITFVKYSGEGGWYYTRQLGRRGLHRILWPKL